MARRYQIRKRDNFRKIAKRFYHDEALFSEHPVNLR